MALMAWSRQGVPRGVAVLALLGMAGSPAGVAGSQQRASIVVLSTRADLVSGGDALVEVRSPPSVNADALRITVDGRDVTNEFVGRPRERLVGLVTGLRDGTNTLSVWDDDRERGRLVLTNHPRGGPLFSGDQLMPWACDTTAEPSLGPPQDAQCNAPAVVRFVYRSTAGRFEPWAPTAGVPSDADTVATPDGGTLPYIVRIERGTLNRGIHEVAVLFDPARPWTPTDPQPQWGRKLLLKYGGGTGQTYRQGRPGPVLDDDAFRRGYAVASSSMLVNGQHANFVTAAETSLMLKEHVIETLGELRFTVGEGGSGGALLQYLIADAYPGILDGLRPTQDWQDSVSGAYREFVDSGAIMHAIESSDLTYTLADRAAIGGWGGTNVTVFNTESRRVIDYIRPDDETDCAGGASYHPTSNPTGIRCTFQDFMAPILGVDGEGSVPQLHDNVGVQYGLSAVNEGLITPAQFVDLNVRAGGFDRDGRWRPERNRMSVDMARRLYRTGQITEGRGLARVPILAIRGTNNDDYHYPYRTIVNRHRLVEANGHADNHVYWIQSSRTPPANTLEAIDRWLTAIEADGSSDPLPVKVVRGRPADVTSGCWINGQKVDDLDRCDETYPYASEPRTTAGDGPTIRTMKCELKPLSRADYRVSFSDEQWRGLSAAFPDGVCDFSRPGVGQEPTVAWLSYALGPGGQPLPPAPRSE